MPFVSVIVPARNEGSKVGRCLESLARQDYPHYEVIAVDDRSDDDTGAVIKKYADKYPHVQYVKGRETPAGWLGKCYALIQAYERSRGQWIIFTDADTCHTPQSLRYALSYAVTNRSELISFMPLQELGSFWERTVMPVLLGSFLCGDPWNTLNEHTNERAYAYGQYILVRRDVYDAVGGHQSVFDQILDDISLARVLKAHGYHITSADGQLLYRVRMYTDLKSLWQGWTKNLYALIECRLSFLVTVILLLNAGLMMPFVWAFLLVSWAASGTPVEHFNSLSLLLVGQLTCLFLWYKRTAAHYLGVGVFDFLLLPLGCLTVSVLYLHSAYLVLSGRKVSWKGRRYTVSTEKSVVNETGGDAAAEAASVTISSSSSTLVSQPISSLPVTAAPVTISKSNPVINPDLAKTPAVASAFAPANTAGAVSGQLDIDR